MEITWTQQAKKTHILKQREVVWGKLDFFSLKYFNQTINIC